MPWGTSGRDGAGLARSRGGLPQLDSVVTAPSSFLPHARAPRPAWHARCTFPNDRITDSALNTTGDRSMFETIARSAAFGSALAFVRRHSPGYKPKTHYLGSLGLIALGVVVGASAGLLLAPKSGSELRADMRSKARELQSRAGERVDRVRSRTHSRVAETNV
jgi:hypothetical protein